jgi:hypothetical protein
MNKSGADRCVWTDDFVCRLRTDERDVGDSPRLNRHLRFAPTLHLCYDVYAQPCECRHCPTIDELDRMPQPSRGVATDGGDKCEDRIS